MSKVTNAVTFIIEDGDFSDQLFAVLTRYLIRYYYINNPSLNSSV